MFAPDQAVMRLHLLSPAAAQMYLYHCRWRDHATGYSRKSFESARRELDLKRATAYRAHKELLDKDWLQETKEGRIGLRGGSFAPYDKTPEARAVWTAPPVKVAPRVPQNGRLQFELEPAASLNFETDSSLNNETENLKIETNRLKIETAHIKDRARGQSINLSISPSISDTHTLSDARAREVDMEAPAARVCVSETSETEKPIVRTAANGDSAGGSTSAGSNDASSVDELEFEDYRGFARSTPSFTKPDAWASIHFNTGDEPSRVLVREWKARQQPEVISAAREAETDGKMFFDEACLYIRSFIHAGHDPEKTVGYVNVTEDVRQRLIERFCKGPPDVREAVGGT